MQIKNLIEKKEIASKLAWGLLRESNHVTSKELFCVTYWQHFTATSKEYLLVLQIYKKRVRVHRYGG
jgi:hypothetical protein